MSLFTELKRRNVLRVVVAYLAGAWLLLQIADVLWPIYGLAESSLQLLTNVLGIGLVPAIILSWVFEWTPDGIRRDIDASEDPEQRRRSGKSLDRIIIVVLTLAVGFFAVDKFLLEPARDAVLESDAEARGRIEALINTYGDRSIAVLPFANMSPDPDQRFFSDGVSEEILNLLTKISELRVISRSSAFQYRDNVHIPTVADELNVAYVLEGSVRQSGNTVRITAQLIDARADAHIWSETWDRDLVDVFDIQDEIAQIVVEAMHVQLLGRKLASRRVDPDLYVEFLQIKRELDNHSPDAEDVQRLERIVEQAPDYVPAINLLGMVYFNSSGTSSHSLYSPQEGAELARATAERALRVDPDDAMANAAMGWLALLYEQDLDTAASLLAKAYALDPHNAEVLAAVSPFAQMLGRFEESIRLAESSVAVDPACSSCYYRLGISAYYAGNYELSDWAYKERMRLSPGGWLSVGRNLMLRGRYAEALEAIDRQTTEMDDFKLPLQAMVYHSQGRTDEYNRVVEQLLAGVAEQLPMDTARMYAWSGEIEYAFEWLDKAQQSDGSALTFVYWDPLLESLRRDPRWPEYISSRWYSKETLADVKFDLRN